MTIIEIDKCKVILNSKPCRLWYTDRSSKKICNISFYNSLELLVLDLNLNEIIINNIICSIFETFEFGTMNCSIPMIVTNGYLYTIEIIEKSPNRFLFKISSFNKTLNLRAYIISLEMYGEEILNFIINLYNEFLSDNSEYNIDYLL